LIPETISSLLYCSTEYENELRFPAAYQIIFEGFEVSLSGFESNSIEINVHLCLAALFLTQTRPLLSFLDCY
jgi:hypothetical protein